MPQMQKIKTLSFLLIILFNSVYLLSQPVKKELNDIMQKYQAVGVSVAVAKGNRIVYKTSLGYKDLDKKVLLRDKDIFRIASISKTFVTTAILQQVEAGKLSLTDDVSDLAGFKIRNPFYPDEKITLAMILSHTSSLSDKGGYFTLDVLQPEKNPQWKDSYNNYTPGSTYQYCNLNFNLAGTILEKISNERFDTYIQKHILHPLKLYGGFNVDMLDSSRFVTLYEYDSSAQHYIASSAYRSLQSLTSNYTFGYSTPGFSPTGGMKISATDLARYMIMHMHYGRYKKKQIVSEEYARKMQTALTNEEGYGLGMRTMYNLIPGKTLKGHNGVAYGLYSSMFFDPTEKFGIVVITNGCNTGYTDGVNDFLKECVNALYKHALLKKQ